MDPGACCLNNLILFFTGGDPLSHTNKDSIPNRFFYSCYHSYLHGGSACPNSGENKERRKRITKEKDTGTRKRIKHPQGKKSII